MDITRTGIVKMAGHQRYVHKKDVCSMFNKLDNV